MAKKPDDKSQKAKAKTESKRVGITELINDVYNACDGVTKVKVDEVIRATLAKIQQSLVKKKSVAITGMFVLEPVLRPARVGRNPQDPSKPVKIPEHWAVKLKLGNSLKNDLNY